MSVIKKEITLEQFSSVCRTCLDTDDLQPLAGTKFVDMIKDISKLESAIEELLPPNICEQCIRKLEDLNAFINLSQQTYRILKDALEEKNSHIEFVRVDGAPENGIAPETMEVAPETIEVAPEIIEVSPEIQGVTECQEMAISDIKSESPSDFEDTDEEEDLVHSNDDEDFPQSSDTEPKKPAPAKKTNTTKPNWQSTHCKVCDTTFNSKKKYNIHLKENPTCKAQKYKCHVCGKIWKSGFRLQHHMRSHTGENPYKCQVCEKGFRYTTNLKRHVENVHMGLKPFVCEICGKEFATLFTTKDHMKSHTRERPYLCHICGKSYPTLSAIRGHDIRHRLKRGDISLTDKQKKLILDRNKNHYYCCYCNKSCSSKQSLQHHMLALHTDVKPFKCEVCDRGFTKKSQLRFHRQLHTGETSFECKLCGMKIRSPSTYYGHMRRHKTENYHKCKMCGKLFERLEELQIHMQTPHTAEKRFQCQHCGQRFTVNRYLKRHMLRVHSDVNNRKSSDDEEEEIVLKVLVD